jgi:hypothetical protein
MTIRCSQESLHLPVKVDQVQNGLKSRQPAA